MIDQLDDANGSTSADSRVSRTVRFIVRRVSMLAGALLVSSFAIFGALYVAPGDPISTLSGGRSLPPETISYLRAQNHLDDPFLERYVKWLGDVVVHQDLGRSITFREDVGTIIASRFGVTLALVAYAGVMILLIGVGLGVLAGLRRGVVDTSVVVTTTVLAAVPSFVSAAVLLSIFSVSLGWLPSLGAGTGVWDRVVHLTLPAAALALSALAVVTRVTRAAIRDELSREHVQTATSRGLPRALVIRRHVLRNAMIPVTTIVGITVASLIVLSAVVEKAFALDGLGAALVQAALTKDFAVVQGIALVFVVAFVFANAVVDVFYSTLDPRVQLGSRDS